MYILFFSGFFTLHFGLKYILNLIQNYNLQDLVFRIIDTVYNTCQNLVASLVSCPQHRNKSSNFYQHHSQLLSGTIHILLNLLQKELGHYLQKWVLRGHLLKQDATVEVKISCVESYGQKNSSQRFLLILNHQTEINIYQSLTKRSHSQKRAWIVLCFQEAIVKVRIFLRIKWHAAENSSNLQKHLG